MVPSSTLPQRTQGNLDMINKKKELGHLRIFMNSGAMSMGFLICSQCYAKTVVDKHILWLQRILPTPPSFLSQNRAIL